MSNFNPQSTRRHFFKYLGVSAASAAAINTLFAQYPATPLLHHVVSSSHISPLSHPREVLELIAAATHKEKKLSY